MFIYGKLRIGVRGFTCDKSDVTKVHELSIKHLFKHYFYTLLGKVFYFSCPVNSSPFVYPVIYPNNLAADIITIFASEDSIFSP